MGDKGRGFSGVLTNTSENTQQNLTFFSNKGEYSAPKFLLLGVCDGR